MYKYVCICVDTSKCMYIHTCDLCLEILCRAKLMQTLLETEYEPPTSCCRSYANLSVPPDFSGTVLIRVKRVGSVLFAVTCAGKMA